MQNYPVNNVPFPIDRSTKEIHFHSIGEAEHEAMRIFDETDENSLMDSHTAVGQKITANHK
jgi:hypothetical protein